jgi:hypothetical protein
MNVSFGAAVGMRFSRRCSARYSANRSAICGLPTAKRRSSTWCSRRCNKRRASSELAVFNVGLYYPSTPSR